MTDIVERLLRENDRLDTEAANEIKKLRKELAAYKNYLHVQRELDKIINDKWVKDYGILHDALQIIAHVENHLTTVDDIKFKAHETLQTIEIEHDL